MPLPKQINDYVQCRVICDTSDLFDSVRLEVECEDQGKSVEYLTVRYYYRKRVFFTFSYVF
jgi:hypothetical protein